MSKSQSINRIHVSKDKDSDYGFNENESLIDKYIQSQNNNHIQVPTHNSNGFSRNNKK